jgi:hypothetical protein
MHPVSVTTLSVSKSNLTRVGRLRRNSEKTVAGAVPAPLQLRFELIVDDATVGDLWRCSETSEM